MRKSNRPTIRPSRPCDLEDLAFDVGAPIDAWWSDGWWEGIIVDADKSEKETYQVYVPGEFCFWFSILLLVLNHMSLYLLNKTVFSFFDIR